jgi:signal transduction histidine kinase
MINQIFVFLIAILGIWLAIWIYLVNPREKSNKWFSAMTFFLVLWVIFAYLGSSADQAFSATIFYRLNWGIVALSALAGYFFIIYFPKETKRCFALDIIVLITTLFFFFISVFTNLVIKKVDLIYWGPNVIFGKLGQIFTIISAFWLIAILGNLFKKYFKSSPKEKLKMSYFLIGGFLFFLLNLIFNIVFPLIFHSVKYQHFGDFSAILLLGFTAYAIVKRELFGIRVVVTTIFVALIAILLAVDTLFFTSELILQIFKGGVLILFLYFGYLLIRSVINEIERREEVERLSRAKSEFISIASHQLRTPLTAIKGYISMILEGTYGKIPEKTKEPMKKVYESNSRLISLVNNLLSISRIESGKLKLELEKASLEDIISNVIDIFQIEAKEKGIYLKFEKPKKPLPKIMLDEEKMTEVISNVVNNDIKYTEKGGITIKVKKLKSKIMIIVKDTGVGMTEDELDKMFKSFSRGMAGNRLYTKGAGLGLYISRKFVEMHNGKIWAESEGKNKGSTFYIELPMK